MFALTVAMGATGEWNIDASRFARESLPPAQYLSSTYYEIWLGGARAPARRARTRRVRTSSSAGRPATRRPRRSSGRSPPPTCPRRSAAAARRRATRRGRRASRSATACARATLNPATHTRLPRYVRGHVGTVERVARLPRLPGHQRARARRGPAVALHGALRRPRAVGRRRRPDGERLDRRVRALPGAGAVTPPPRPAARCRRTRLRRAVGGAGVRAGGRAARARASSPGRSGPRRSPRRSSAPPARATTTTGSPRWRSWWPRRAHGCRHAPALRGRVGARRRPHAPRDADRAAGGGLRRTASLTSPEGWQSGRMRRS